MQCYFCRKTKESQEFQRIIERSLNNLYHANYMKHPCYNLFILLWLTGKSKCSKLNHFHSCMRIFPVLPPTH